MTEPDAARLARDPDFHRFISWLVQKAATLQPWRAQGACLGAPSKWFYPKNPDAATPAYALCEVCPVRSECLKFALADLVYDIDDPERPCGRVIEGIWGGTSERQRRELRG